MLIDNGYLLTLPGFVADRFDRVALYPVDSLLALRQSAAPLTGHPSLDLAADDWLIVAADARRVERWTLRDRLVKVRPNPGGDSWRLTFVEPKEWRKWLSDEDWQWLKTVCDCAALVTEAADAAKNAISADSGAADDPGATQGQRRGKATKRQGKAARKMKRRQQRKTEFER